jgi:hypothetical protein
MLLSGMPLQPWTASRGVARQAPLNAARRGGLASSAVGYAPARTTLIRLPALLFASAVLSEGGLQAQALSFEPERVAWRLVDFVVLGDSTHGVQLLLSPSLQSVQGQDHSRDMAITLDPLSARRWIAAAMRSIDSVAQLPHRDRRPFVLSPLLGNQGQTGLSVARRGREPRDEPFRIAIAELSNPRSGLAVTASASDLRTLFTAVDAAAQASAVDSTNTSIFVACQLDVPPRVRRRGWLTYPRQQERLGGQGRVLLQFIIDSTGSVLPASIRALLSDGEAFTLAAREEILSATYSPGMVGARPISTRVWQWVDFRFAR